MVRQTRRGAAPDAAALRPRRHAVSLPIRDVPPGAMQSHRPQSPTPSTTMRRTSPTLSVIKSAQKPLPVHRPPISPHPCARHRDPVTARLRRGRTPRHGKCFLPKDLGGWIPVTSTGMKVVGGALRPFGSPRLLHLPSVQPDTQLPRSSAPTRLMPDCQWTAPHPWRRAASIFSSVSSTRRILSGGRPTISVTRA